MLRSSSTACFLLEKMPALPPVKKYVSNSGVRIYRIPCQAFDTLSARVHLLLEAGPPTLVDSGSGVGHCTQQILAGLDVVRTQFGESVQLTDIRRILVSHGHVDHIGGLADLVRRTHAEVAVHPLEVGPVASYCEHVAISNFRLDHYFRQSGVEPKRRAQLLRDLRFNNQPVESVPVGRLLEDGQLLDGLQVIHTPGHSPGHLCLGLGNILLSSDHVLARTVPQQWPECTAPYTGLGHYLESLDKVQRMPGFELTLAAHEQTITNLYDRIDAIRSSHQRRLERLLNSLREAARPLSVDEITRLLYPEVTGFRAVLAITDVGARVEYLHQRGLLKVADFEQLVDGDFDAVFRYEVV
ncbi:MAG: MBL fold metallo-hydrolase [Planctomycetaceae bacterium]|nr:MBL fold metallo-hydrolase [Planctomycetaceae bacterium]